ncbi:DUF4383 domain-containing protein [Quadrisphaera setariae]|uniref:DUF4383 domain-containing protein n=1 Tax=Quadrisphaera setariae TaxID=2593304 RepID=A0A5C8ZAC0_9ACTN|nr:DUF4383 domain-containing protein [Quadrisphaera setariae]TXR55045.1 DUF4383 domain-containing protein [Quadrisphaera setariae]
MSSTTSPRADVESAGRDRWTPVRLAGAGLGAVYLLVGVAGFVLTGVTSWSMHHSETLLVFQVNPVHNVAHLGLGAALLVGAVLGTETARGVDRLVGVVFLLLGLVGPFVMGGHADPLALNSPDHALHLGTAAVLLGVVWATRTRRTA